MEKIIREILAFLFVLYFIMGGISLIGYFVSPNDVPYFTLLVLIPLLISIFFGIIFFIIIPIVSWILDLDI